jgi:hypothetical protein
MVKIDDGVSFRRTLFIAGRKEDPVIPDLTQHMAVMPGIDNADLVCLRV